MEELLHDNLQMKPLDSEDEDNNDEYVVISDDKSLDDKFLEESQMPFTYKNKTPALSEVSELDHIIPSVSGFQVFFFN